MADNYLEQRMDDLRSGRLRPASNPPVSAPRRKGYIQVPFPSRRVLIIEGVSGIGLSVARAFIKAGCKVAIFDRDKAAGDKLAHDEGVRFCHIDFSDTTAVEASFLNLLKAWRDMDIIVNTHADMHPVLIIGKLWEMHRRRYPSTSDFGGRLINVMPIEKNRPDKENASSVTQSLIMSLSGFGITVNSISFGESATPGSHEGTIARACIFLSLPGNECINGADITIDGGMSRLIF